MVLILKLFCPSKEPTQSDLEVGGGGGGGGEGEEGADNWQEEEGK
jgi:hypothetical protein